MRWRYIPPFSASGDLQLALDHWLLDRCAQELHPPTLRFYTWHPTSISLGYFQKKWPVHWNDLSWQGHAIPLLRRPTGGRAVLHHGDLTYAIIASDLQGSKRQAYEQLCRFLIKGWQTLGVTLRYGQSGPGYHQQSNCFRVATSADLVCVDGRKLIGSAQCWRRTTVLQQGSIQLSVDPQLSERVFGEISVDGNPGSQGSEVDQRPSPLSFPSIEEIIPALVESAADVLQADFKVLPVGEAEWNDLAPYQAQTQI